MLAANLLGGEPISTTSTSLYQDNVPENLFSQKEILVLIPLIRKTPFNEILDWQDCNYTRDSLAHLQKKAHQEMGRAQQLYDVLLEKDAQFYLELEEESLDKDMKIKISRVFDDGRRNPTEVGPFETSLFIKPKQATATLVREDIVLHMLILITLRKGSRLNFLVKSTDANCIPSFLMSGLVRLDHPVMGLTDDQIKRLNDLKLLDKSEPPSAKRV